MHPEYGRIQTSLLGLMKMPDDPIALSKFGDACRTLAMGEWAALASEYASLPAERRASFLAEHWQRVPFAAAIRFGFASRQAASLTEEFRATTATMQQAGAVLESSLRQMLEKCGLSVPIGDDVAIVPHLLLQPKASA
jgi:hypothetical protein